MKQILNNDFKAAELYRLSYQCEEFRVHGNCNGNCAACQFNTSLYTDDVREALLIKTSAQIDYSKDKEASIQNTYNHFVGIIFALLAVIFLMWKCGTPKKETVIYKAPPQDTTSTSTHLNLTQTLLRIKNNVYDINKDGIINCIDYSILFCTIYGNDTVARIIVNVNPKTGMNHMFVRAKFIYGGTTWVYVEPQEPYNYIMPSYWGDKYDPAYNVDETDYWMGMYGPGPHYE